MARKAEYKPEYGDMLIAHRRKGGTLESFAGLIGVTRPTIYNWVERYPDFKEAKDIAQCAAAYFWKKVGIDGIQGKIQGFNARLWTLNYRNVMQPFWQEEARQRAADRVELILHCPWPDPWRAAEWQKQQLQ
jgi:hypothetical protein